MTGRLGVALPLLGITGSLAAVLLVGAPADTRFWSATFDAGHAPLFGAVAICVLVLARRRPRLAGSPWRPYLLALGTTVLLGAGTEFAQFFGPRDSDPVDLLRNVVGALAFLAAAAAFDRDLLAGKRTRVRLLALAGSALILVLVCVPVVLTMRAYVQRDAAFPVLFDFAGSWCRQFVRHRHATMSFVAPPAEWPEPAPAAVGRILLSASRFPGVTLEEEREDWSGFGTLSFDIFNPSAHAVQIRVAVDDRLNRVERAARYDRPWILVPGLNRLRIPCDELRRGPLRGSLDTNAVRQIAFYSIYLDRPVELFVGPIRLERGDAQTRIERTVRISGIPAIRSRASVGTGLSMLMIDTARSVPSTRPS